MYRFIRVFLMHIKLYSIYPMIVQYNLIYVNEIKHNQKIIIKYTT